MITFMNATEAHIEKLTALSKAAFDTDISVGNACLESAHIRLLHEVRIC
jgi:hypothetical protein